MAHGGIVNANPGALGYGDRIFSGILRSRNQFVASCMGLVSVGGVGGGRPGGQCEGAHEEDIEVLREILVAGRCGDNAHVGAVTAQQDILNPLVPQKLLQGPISQPVVDDNVIGIVAEVFRHGNVFRPLLRVESVQIGFQFLLALGSLRGTGAVLVIAVDFAANGVGRSRQTVGNHRQTAAQRLHKGANNIREVVEAKQVVGM